MGEDNKIGKWHFEGMANGDLVGKEITRGQWPDSEVLVRAW